MQRVLIVDDEPRNQRIVAETLDGVVEFHMAANGEEALSAVERHSPDLVLLDIMMPGIDGYEVCRRLRADPQRATLKIILISGRAMIEERLMGYEALADDYMTKPFAPEELLAKVKVFLRLARVERELCDFNRSLELKVEVRTTKLLDAEAKLMTAAKMSALGEMAGGIAHEINTPLGTINLLSQQLQELMTDETIDRDTVSRMAGAISVTTHRISQIIQGLRTFSRDGSQDQYESALFSSILRDTLALCQEKLKHADVRLVLDPSSPELRIRCRPVEVAQVLLNLISNACDAIAPLPVKWIAISTVRKLGKVLVSVTDSGSGLSSELRDKVFQPFFTTKSVGQGTGLGLSISKGIMRAHQGALELDVSCANTRFVLEFPEFPDEEIGLPQAV